MHRFIIDDTGRLWNTASWQIRQHFHITGENAEVERQLVRLVGCIAVRFANDCVNVVVNPRITAQTALARLLYFVADEAPRRIAIGVTSSNIIKVFNRQPDALEFVRTLIREARKGPDVDCRLSDVSPQMIMAESTLGQLIVMHSGTQGRFDIEQYHTFLEQGMSGRWLVLEPAGTGDDMRIVACGSGYGIPTPEFCRQLPGALFSSLPDSRFIRWLGKSYGRAVHSKEILYQVAHTMAYWPNAGVVKSEYARLVLPMKYGRRDLLLSTSRRLDIADVA